MKASLPLLFCIALFTAAPSAAADVEKPETTYRLKLQQIDLELCFEQYKQVRMEQFKTEMRLELLDTEGELGKEEQKAEHERLRQRTEKLREMAGKLRARIAELGSQLAVAAK